MSLPVFLFFERDVCLQGIRCASSLFLSGYAWRSEIPEIVSFVGAGPGDPGLITVKGQEIIKTADVLIYAGRLVSPQIVALAPAMAQVWDGAYLTLEENHDLLRDAAYSGKRAVHLHTGDPSIYSPLPEQLQLLKRDGIPWRIIPGVTAAMAAAAMAGISFSIPGISQSLVITRLAGSMPMPANEELERLAKIGAPMAIYIAGHKCDQVQARLSGVLPQETPVICCSRIGWPEEKIINATVGSLAQTGVKHQLGRQVVLLVVPYLDAGD